MLEPGGIEHRRDIVLHIAVLGVLDQPDDLDVHRVGPAVGHVLADRGVAEVELFGEGLVHDGDPGGSQPIARGELAPRKQPDPQGPEVAGAHLVEAGVVVNVRSRSKALDIHAAPPVAAREERHYRGGDTGGARQRHQRVLHSLVQQLGPGAVVAAPHGRDHERDDVLHLQANIHPRHVDEALEQQTGGGEERRRQRDLCGHQAAAEAGRDPSARQLARTAANRGDQVGAGGVQRRKQAEQQPGADGDPGGEEQHGRLELEPERGRGFGREQRPDRREGPLRDQQAGRAAHERQDDRLRQELGQQVAAAGAERQSHAHLGGPGGAARQQQVGDVGAGDQQDHGGDREQQDERRAGFAVQRALTPVARPHLERLGLEAGHRGLAHVLLQRGFDIHDDRAIDGRQRRLRLLGRDAGLQSSEQVGPVGAAILHAIEPGDHPSHAERHEDLRPAAQGGPVEALRRDTHDLERLAVHDDRLAEHPVIAAEVGLPVIVAQDGHEMRAERPVVARTEQAAEGGLQAQRREVGA